MEFIVIAVQLIRVNSTIQGYPQITMPVIKLYSTASTILYRKPHDKMEENLILRECFSIILILRVYPADEFSFALPRTATILHFPYTSNPRKPSAVITTTNLLSYNLYFGCTPVGRSTALPCAHTPAIERKYLYHVAQPTAKTIIKILSYCILYSFPHAAPHFLRTISTTLLWRDDSENIRM